MDRAALVDLVADRLRDVPDFPTAGVIFQDFTPLLADGAALRAVVDDIVARFAGHVDTVAGIEARGFMLGAAAAVGLGVGFVPIRKAGKLPRRTYEATYALEYATATLQLHTDAFAPRSRVLLVDDVLATGGTAAAACELVERAGGHVVAVDVVVEISALGGRSRLSGHRVLSLLAL